MEKRGKHPIFHSTFSSTNVKNYKIRKHEEFKVETFPDEELQMKVEVVLTEEEERVEFKSEKDDLTLKQLK